MELVALETNRDIDVAIAHLERGTTIRVEVADDDGPRGPEPKVELLRLLLDDMAGSYRAEDLTYVPHPWIDRRYLQGCVLRPVRPGGEPGGVREPRNPRNDPPHLRVSADRPAESGPLVPTTIEKSEISRFR